MVTENKRLERMRKIGVKGQGKECPKCFKLMERRVHNKKPKNEWFYSEWDYCKDCKHVQHYDEFKSSAWVESEQNETMFNNSLFKE